MNNAQNSYSGNAPAASEKSPLPTRWFFSRIFCFLLALGIWIYVVNITTQDFERTFSSYQVFSNTYTIDQVQAELNEELIDDIISQIFNATVANW